jgi:hypothetical protein
MIKPGMQTLPVTDKSPEEAYEGRYTRDRTKQQVVLIGLGCGSPTLDQFKETAQFSKQLSEKRAPASG